MVNLAGTDCYVYSLCRLVSARPRSLTHGNLQRNCSSIYTFLTGLVILLLNINMFLVLFYPGLVALVLAFLSFLNQYFCVESGPEEEVNNKTTLHTTGRDR